MIERTDLAEVFTRKWDSLSLPDLDVFLATAGPVDAVQLSRLARIDQAQRWQRSDRRSVEEYLDHYPALQADHDSAVDLIYHEYLLREKLAEQPSLEEFTSRFPRHATAIAEQVSFHRALVAADESVSDELSMQSEASRVDRIESPLPRQLPAEFGRYRVLQLLGRGGMGCVYIAEDTQLGRQVALKLPRVDRDVSPEVLKRFRQEARIAATFHHPNLCPVYDFGELDGTLYLTMPLISGQPLSARLEAGPLPAKEAVQIAEKIARAMSVAHRAGVVHRDLKPSNILLREDGEPIVMDFGLARRSLELDPKLTGSGTLLGTLAYMAPERIRSSNDEASRESDVYGLGVILYEMLTGRRPFEGNWQEVWDQIRSQPPPPPTERVAGLSAGFDSICLRALAKDPRDRYASMDALADALSQLGKQPAAAIIPRGLVRQWETLRWTRRRTLSVLMTVALFTLLVWVGWSTWRSTALRWSRQQIPVIERLATEQRYFEAYDLAGRVRHYLRDEPTVTRLMPLISDTLTVTSEPSGARVYAQRFVAGPEAAGRGPTFIGTTPISHLKIARGDYLVRVEKAGYTPFQRTWSGLVAGAAAAPIIIESAAVNATLTAASKTPPGMVFVPGGDYRLVAWSAVTTDEVELDGFFIDQCEITNHEYQEFITSGGYRDPRFWTEPFLKDGRALSWEDAMQELKDTTRLPGPREWSEQSYPEGQAEHPVTGITWYEALAYANFRGKTLPTIFQWEKAARNGNTTPIAMTMPWGISTVTAGRANLASRGTVPVGSLKFGMSPFGCFDMAGNVAEWCLNGTSQGYLAPGASWASRAYEFAYYGAYSGDHHSNRLGFRCVKNLGAEGSNPSAMWLDLDDEVPEFIPAPEAEVKTWLTKYAYDNVAPLDARVDERSETDQWTREKISFAGVDGARVIAYLYLPKHFPPPYQVIHLVPAGDVGLGYRTVPQSVENDYYASFVRSGRALFVVVLRGYLGREWPVRRQTPARDSPEYVAEVLGHIHDLRRGLDYLEGRHDLETGKIASLQVSAGGTIAGLPAIDNRYRALILQGAGLSGRWEKRVPPELSLVHLAPLIHVPKLLVNGRYDETRRYATEFQPLYNLLKDPKQSVIYPGGHRPDADEFVPPINAFLDQQLGRVRTQPED